MAAVSSRRFSGGRSRQPATLSAARGAAVLLAVLIDQTRRVADSLRESERRFRVLADTAPVLIWMAGPDKLCDFFNKNWLDFTGRTLAEEAGNGWAAGVHPADSQHCYKLYVSCFDARLPFGMDYRLRRHDGEYRWILDRGVPRYGPAGEFLGYVGTAINVTDRRVQEEAVRRSEQRYRDVVEKQTDFVCRFVADTTLTFVNEAYCRFLRCDKDELLDQTFMSLLPAASQASTLACLATAVSSREACEWECDAESADGALASVHWTCRALFEPRGGFRSFRRSVMTLPTANGPRRRTASWPTRAASPHSGSSPPSWRIRSTSPSVPSSATPRRPAPCCGPRPRRLVRCVRFWRTFRRTVCVCPRWFRVSAR